MKIRTGLWAALLLLGTSIFGVGCGGSDDEAFSDVHFEFIRVSEDGNSVGTVVATWDKNSVPSLVRYDFFRANSINEEGTRIRTEEYPGMVDRMEFTGFDESTTYYYYIVAVGSSGEMDRTDAFEVAVLADEYSRIPRLTASNSVEGIRLEWYLRQHHTDVDPMRLYRKSGTGEYEQVHRYNPFYSYSKDDIEGEFKDTLTSSDDGTVFTYVLVAHYSDGEEVDSNEVSIEFVYREQAAAPDINPPLINNVTAEEEANGIKFVVDYDKNNEPGIIYTLNIRFVAQTDGAYVDISVHPMDPDSHQEFFTQEELSQLENQGIYDVEFSIDAIFNDDKETSNVFTVNNLDISW